MCASKVHAPPHWFWVHGALIATQVMFGTGGVIGALGLPTFNPLLFALIREGCAGPILLCAALAWTPTRFVDVLREWREFAFLGLFIFGNQLAFIVGLKLSNPVAGSIWQPSQPIFTAALAIWLGMERPSARRLGGIFLAFAGCALMVWLSAAGVGANGVVDEVAGNCFFFVNCLATSLYVIRSKPLLRRFPALSVTAYSYMAATRVRRFHSRGGARPSSSDPGPTLREWAGLPPFSGGTCGSRAPTTQVASGFMLCTALAINSIPPALDFICPDCGGRAWDVPIPALYALAYWILFQSVGAAPRPKNVLRPPVVAPRRARPPAGARSDRPAQGRTRS